MSEINFNCPLQPVGDRVIVQPDPSEEITKGGLHIPDNARERPQQGTIIKCGEGRGVDNEVLKALNEIKAKLGIGEIKVPIIYKPGMRILYGRYSGTEIEYKEVKYLIMRMSDIAAIVEE